MHRKASNWLITLIFGGILSSSALSELDTSRYIPVDEIQPGMEAYCLSVLEGTKIERFPVKILSIVHNTEPGIDRILILVEDERFRHMGAIHGCSGSPVYIDGRMAGAMSAGWDGSLDPLYLVTPIEDMLQVDKLPIGNEHEPANLALKNLFDFENIERQYLQYLKTHYLSRQKVPLALSFPASASSSIAAELDAVGLVPVSSPSGLGGTTTSSMDGAQSFAPGGVLAVPLCSGDLSMAAVGTVTEVIGDRIYGFGHPFLGYGQVEMPMAAGFVHTVVASRSMTFKFSSPGPVLGTLTFDRASAVAGVIGPTPPQIPLKIKVRRFDNRTENEYHCQLATSRVMTPLICRMVLLAAGEAYGGYPPEHHTRYAVHINLKDHESVRFSNVSSGMGMMLASSEVASLLATLMLNPYQPVEVRSIEVTADIQPKLTDAEIREVKLSDLKTKAGQTLTAQVTLEGYRADRTVHEITLQIPESLKPGNYPLQILSRDEYVSFLQKSAMHRFAPDNLESMLRIFRQVLSIPRNRLYAVMPLPEGGITFYGKELPDLPNSHMLLLQDTRRMMPKTLYRQWIQSETDLDQIPSGSLALQLTVEP